MVEALFREKVYTFFHISVDDSKQSIGSCPLDQSDGRKSYPQ